MLTRCRGWAGRYRRALRFTDANSLMEAAVTGEGIALGYVKVTYDPVFKLSEDGKRYVSAASDVPTELAEPGLPFSLVFRCEPGKEDIILKVASTYEAASKRRIPPPAFGPIPA